MSNPVTHKIITKAEADAIRRDDKRFWDVFETLYDEDTQAAIDEGRPAFWTFHTYHQATFCHAVTLANNESLDFGLEHVVWAFEGAGRDPQPAIRDFLDRIAPANAAGKAAIQAAMAKWLHTVVIDEIEVAA